MTFDITVLFEAILTLGSIILVRYFIPWVKSKLDEDKMTTLITLVDVFVSSAEQMYNSEQGQEKKDYVFGKLLEKGYEVDEPEIEALIESTVLRLHKELSTR